MFRCILAPKLFVSLEFRVFGLLLLYERPRLVSVDCFFQDAVPVVFRFDRFVLGYMVGGVELLRISGGLERRRLVC